jgi:hypothetical protein
VAALVAVLLVVGCGGRWALWWRGLVLEAEAGPQMASLGQAWEWVVIVEARRPKELLLLAVLG